MRHVCSLVVAAAGAASSASAYQTYGSEGAWMSSLGADARVDLEGFDGASLGYYSPTDLGGSAATAFAKYVGGGPSNAARTSYAGSTLVDAGGLWSITTTNASKPGNAAMFLLADPNDKNDVDNVRGKVSGGGSSVFDPYLSFYNAGTSLTIALGGATGYGGFAFESFDLTEGRVDISWFDGELHGETLFPGAFDSFFGFAGGTDPLEWVRITSVGNQGIAVDNLRFASVSIPTPGSAALGLVGAAMLAGRRRRH